MSHSSGSAVAYASTVVGAGVPDALRTRTKCAVVVSLVSRSGSILPKVVATVLLLYTL